MGKQYKVKDINKNGVKEQWEIDRYAKINQSQGTAQFGIIKHLSGGGNISQLLQSQPGSQSVLKPNRSVNNMSNMVRQQPRQPMGMDVSTNAQILNQAYDPRMAVNYMQQQGMAKTGSIGPAQGFLGYEEGKSENTKTTESKEDKKIKKLAKKEKENQESDNTSARKTAANQQKIKNQLDKKKRLEKRAKRQKGRQERKEIRKKAREGKMTRGEKRKAIIDSRDKQKGKGPAQVNQVKPTKDNKYGRNPDDYHPDANLNDKYPRRKENDPRSKTFQKNLKNK